MGRVKVVFDDESSSEEEERREERGERHRGVGVKSERLQLRAAMEESSRDAEEKEKEKKERAGRKRPRSEPTETKEKKEKKPKAEKKHVKEARRGKEKEEPKARKLKRRGSREVHQKTTARDDKGKAAEHERNGDGDAAKMQEQEQGAVDARQSDDAKVKPTSEKETHAVEKVVDAHGAKRPRQHAVSDSSDEGDRYPPVRSKQRKASAQDERVAATHSAKAPRDRRDSSDASESTRRRLKRPSSVMSGASKKGGEDGKTHGEASERIKEKKRALGERSDAPRPRKPPAEKRGKREQSKVASLDDFLKHEASHGRDSDFARASVTKSEKKARERPIPLSLNQYLDATKDEVAHMGIYGDHEGRNGVVKGVAQSDKSEFCEETANSDEAKVKTSKEDNADDTRSTEKKQDVEIIENDEQLTQNGSFDNAKTVSEEPKTNQVTPQNDATNSVPPSETSGNEDGKANDTTHPNPSQVAAVSPAKSEDSSSNVPPGGSSLKVSGDKEALQPGSSGVEEDEEGAVSDQEPVAVKVDAQPSKSTSTSSETHAEPVMDAVDPMSFVIPKKRVVRDTNGKQPSEPTSLSTTRTNVTTTGDTGVPRMSLSTSPSAADTTVPVNAVEETKQPPRTKAVIPQSMQPLSQDEKHYMRLAKKSNSILKPAAMIVSRDKTLKPHMLSAFGNVMDRYGVIVDGKPLHENKKRMWCPTRKEIKKSGNPPAFFGVNMEAPMHGRDETAEEDNSVDKILMKPAPTPSYERLEFERQGEREWYQQHFYGTKFIPQMLRERVTLVMHNARYVRRATGLLFNAQRDKEEYMEQLEERYKIKDRKPRCDILQKNWQQLVNGRVAFVFLHYKTREDAVAARAQFKDDDGRPLTFKGESRSNEPMAGSGRVGGAPIRMSPSPPPGPSHRSRSPRRPPHEDRDWNRRDRGRPSFTACDGRMNGRYGPGQHPRSPVGQPPRRRSRSRSRSRPRLPHAETQRLHPGDRPHADDVRSSQSSNAEASQTSHHSHEATGISQDSSHEEGEFVSKDNTHVGGQNSGCGNGERSSPHRHRRSRSRSRPRMRDSKDHPYGGHRVYDERSGGPHPTDRGRGRSPPPHHHWGDRDRRHIDERDRYHSGDQFHRPNHPHDQRPNDHHPGPQGDYHHHQREEDFRRRRFRNGTRGYH